MKRHPFRAALPLVLVALVAAPAYFLALQAGANAHFGIGRLDRGFLADPEQFYSPSRMSGPVRHADGSVEVQELVGRLTKTSASLRLPYRAISTPLELRVRCHRFGLEGTVALTVNGHHLEDFVFARSSYPWGGIRTVVPQDVVESGPITVDWVVRDGQTPPDHLPPDLGLGVDWIELTPLSEDVVVIPTARQWLQLGLWFVFGALFFRFLRLPPIPEAIAVASVLALYIMMAAVDPVLADALGRYGWLAFAFSLVLIWLAELADRWSP